MDTLKDTYPTSNLDNLISLNVVSGVNHFTKVESPNSHVDKLSEKLLEMKVTHDKVKPVDALEL